MRKFPFIAVGVLSIASTVWAGDVTLRWTPAAGATGYKIEQSVDDMATWTVVATVTDSVCTGTPAECSTTVTAPATGRVLFRFVATNAAGETTRYDAGAWYCESCNPPAAATNVGVQ